MYITLHNNPEGSAFAPTLQKRKPTLRLVVEPVRGRTRILPQVCVTSKSLLIGVALRNVIRNVKIITLQ